MDWDELGFKTRILMGLPRVLDGSDMIHRVRRQRLGADEKLGMCAIAMKLFQVSPWGEAKERERERERGCI